MRTLQDTNTTYSAGTGLSLSGTTFSNSGATGVKGNAESSYRTGQVNLTAANIGALPLTGGTLTGNVALKISALDASKANNNLSSGINYSTVFNILDTSNRIMVRNEGIINSNGSIGSFWYVRNYNTSGTQVAQKGIAFHMNKSGNLTYAIDDRLAFKNAAGITSGTNAPSGGSHGDIHVQYNSSGNDAIRYYTAEVTFSNSSTGKATWNVMQVDKMVVMNTYWTCKNNHPITTAWGNCYVSNFTDTTPNFPLTFASIPSVSIEYCRADSGASYDAWVMTDESTLSTTNGGKFRLIRTPNATVGHPTMSEIVVGIIA